MKKWFEPLTTAWVGIVTHKLRSSLTILGVVIGVAAVIALMSLGRGTETYIRPSIEGLGSNLVFVQPGYTVQGTGGSARDSASTLTLEDAIAIEKRVPYLVSVAPYHYATLQVIVGWQNRRLRVTGVTPEYQQIYNLQMAEGNFISQYEYRAGMKVAVLGPSIKETLFSYDDPIGQPLRMGNITVRVIGVLQNKGTSMMGSIDEAILIPLTALQQAVTQPRTIRGEHVIGSIVVSVDDREHTDYVTNEISALLRYRHGLLPGTDDDFYIGSR